jgi:hypothetical protein
MMALYLEVVIRVWVTLTATRFLKNHFLTTLLRGPLEAAR